MKRMVLLLTVLLAALALTACGQQEQGPEKDVPPVEGISQTEQNDGAAAGKLVYLPLWMEPYSVVYYDADLNRTIASGGDLTEEEINSREDVLAVGMYGDELAEPDTKVEYDLHGFIQNIYYKTADGTGYQLEAPHAGS